LPDLVHVFPNLVVKTSRLAPQSRSRIEAASAPIPLASLACKRRKERRAKNVLADSYSMEHVLTRVQWITKKLEATLVLVNKLRLVPLGSLAAHVLTRLATLASKHLGSTTSVLFAKTQHTSVMVSVPPPVVNSMPLDDQTLDVFAKGHHSNASTTLSFLTGRFWKTFANVTLTLVETIAECAKPI